MTTLSINDAIHKAVTLSPREAEIVDHPYMQRLRFIRQLGFVSLVYPCATHDRFSHAIGTLHVATLFAGQLLMNEEYSLLARLLTSSEKEFLTRIIRMSALLHDVGHAPFSHTAESAMPEAGELAIPSSWIARATEPRIACHEDYSVLLMVGMSEGPRGVITRDEAEIIASLVHHKYIRVPESWKRHFSPAINSRSLHAVLKTIISSDIDADRMDYLLRDAHFAGVSYGHFDLPWLVSNLGTIKQDDAYKVSISETGVQALEHYLLARSNMYTQVYMHKTVKCFDYYFHKAIAEKEIDYRIPSDRDAYAAMRDSTLIELLFAAARNAGSWSSRLVNREPAKRLCRVWGSQRDGELLFHRIREELKPHGVQPFLHFAKRKFLESSDGEENEMKKTNTSLFSGLASIPVAVVRKQFGVVSAAPLSDYAFILKRYHDDVSVGDIYVPQDQYHEHEKIIHRVIKKFHTYSPTETILFEGE